MIRFQHFSTTKLWRDKSSTILHLFSGGFLGLFLLSACDRTPQNTVEKQEATAVAEIKPVVKETQYPEFERDERIAHIAGLKVDPAVGEEAFQICATCHGVDGLGSRDGAVPRLAGQHREVIARRLVEISTGIRMRPEMESYKEAIESDKQIAALSIHIAKLSDPDDVREGPGTALDLGQTVFEDLCVSCHGGQGYGHRGGGIPRIGGWDYDSVRKTLIKLADPNSEIHETGMSDLVSMITLEEVDAIADYVSRLRPNEPED